MQFKVSKKKLISLAAYFVIADVIALGFIIYVARYPNDCVQKMASAAGFVISSNEYQQAAHKIADAVKNQKIPGGRMLILGVWVDQTGKVFAMDVESHDVILDESPHWEQRKELIGGINLINLPFETVSGLLVLTEGDEQLVGQSAMVYQRKPLSSQ